jgi:UDPglucose 6-dehydrogenase
MKISVIGTGYVGLVAGACFADLGNDVLCLDPDEARLEKLNRGEIPIYEPGLQPIVQRNVAAGRLRFTGNGAAGAAHGIVQFITVGTPGNEDGSVDLSHVVEAARQIGRHMNAYRVVVNKSTVPVGTVERVRTVIKTELVRRQTNVAFSVASNPEFLKEGNAVEDFMRPDRVIIGASDPRAIEILRSIYAPMQRNHERMIVMDVASAELTKYVANAMLATRISFMNEIADLAEQLGADIEQVRRGIGSDPRIGYHFLYAGSGYGGSCLPKDLAALARTAREHDTELQLLAATQRVNGAQKQRLLAKIVARLGPDLGGMRIALWGLAFKPNTDDMRDAPSIALIDALLARGATVSAYDPAAMPAARGLYANEPRVMFATTPLAAVDGAEALAIVTEWKEFRSPDFGEIRKRLKQPLVFDGRNLYEPVLVRRFGLEYFGIGRGDRDYGSGKSKSAQGPALAESYRTDHDIDGLVPDTPAALAP